MNHTTDSIQTITSSMNSSSFHPIILSIDGNIGSGKSTLYKDLQEYYHDNTDICFVPEPVDDWSHVVDGDNVPILTNLYKNTKKYAFRFQMMAYISRLHLLRQKVKENKYRIIISERSVQTDRNVFAKMLFDDGMIEHDEYQIYNKWFDEFLDDMYLGGIIYVKAEPEICAERVKIRAREGETIPLDYLQKCHKYHEDWLETNTDKLVIEANIDTSVIENASVRDQWIQSVDEWISSKFLDNHNVSNDNINTDDNIAHVKQETTDELPILQFDGACRGNPSNVLGLGCIIKNSNRTKTLAKGSYHNPWLDVNGGTNNEAEYLSLIKGLELGLYSNMNALHVEGDSSLIINQMNGTNKVNAKNLIPLHTQAKELEKRFHYIDYKHIKREFNKDADKLANMGLDNAVDNADDKDVTKCEGCVPRFQENQMAHMGPNGCIDY
jgi:deoxyadenosine/deoxycytidine kinase/ribonuclease HI